MYITLNLCISWKTLAEINNGIEDLSFAEMVNSKHEDGNVLI